MRIHLVSITAAMLWCVASAANAQSVAERVKQAGDGTVRFSFAARPGVCGDGRSNIRVSDSRNKDVEWECEPGPVMVALDKQGARVTSLRTYVGAKWRAGGSEVIQLGTVGVRDAVDFLLGLTESSETKAAEQAVFPTTLADSVEIWPRLLRLARDDARPRGVRSQAVFWLGQAAGAEATKGLADIADDANGDREVRKAAVFALSQQKADGVESLLRIARANKDPEIRRQAIFWLGQSKDPRALDYFESVLTRK